MDENGHDFPVIDVVIKFGGSSITNKDTLESVKTDELQRACQYVKKCQDAGLKCLVVHGAGSFGHHQAKQYQVNKGLTLNDEVSDRNKMWGYVLTRQSVTKLNKLVVDRLVQNGVFAIGCSPGSSWRTDLRKPTKWQANEIANFLAMDMVPVFHGDCCLDETLGCCILSGDTVIQVCLSVTVTVTGGLAVARQIHDFFLLTIPQTVCSRFEVRRVVFLTDVSGVYDRPPDQAGAKLLKTIAVNSDGSFQSNIEMGDSSQYDVTGGIRLKLKTATDIITSSKTVCPVYVCGVNSTEAETLCLRNRMPDQDLNATEITMTK